MDIGIVSGRYAHALFEYAEDMKVTDKVYHEMGMLCTSLLKLPRMKQVLSNPLVKESDKLQLLQTAAQVEEKVTDVTYNFLKLVLQKKREMFLLFICKSFLGLYHKHRNLEEAKLITAVPVSEEVKERIEKTVESFIHRQVNPHCVVDPSIEGGFVFQTEQYRIDASLSAQLRHVKKELIDKNRRLV